MAKMVGEQNGMLHRRASPIHAMLKGNCGQSISIPKT
jgi:hypothetical protein